MKRFRDLCCCFVSLAGVFVASCGHKRPKAKAPARAPRQQTVRAVPIGTKEEGIASWYGVPYHGKPAANGEIYDMEQMVAAHRTLPFNTWLKVTNLSNGRTVNVRVIDRGPFIESRILDLSKAAARRIQLLGPGVGKVRLEVISAPADIPAEDYYGVQVGAFSNLANAERLKTKYEGRFGYAQVSPKLGRTTLYRVIIGKAATEEEARKIADQLAPEFNHVFVVRLDHEEKAAVNSTKKAALVE